jgi:hypothetical protein
MDQGAFLLRRYGSSLFGAVHFWSSSLLEQFTWALSAAMQMAIQAVSHNTILVSSRPGSRPPRKPAKYRFART